MDYGAGPVRNVRAAVGRDRYAARGGQAGRPRVGGGGHAVCRVVVYDAPVARVRYADAPVGAGGHPGRPAKIPAGSRGDRPVVREVGVEYDDPVVSRVGHYDAPAAAGLDGDRLGRVERAGAGHGCDGGKVAAEPVVLHDAVVAGVCNYDAAILPRGGPHGRAHVEHSRPLAAERQPVARRRVEHLHPVVARVGHYDAPAGGVDVDVGRRAERDVVDAGRGELDRGAQAHGCYAHDRL